MANLAQRRPTETASPVVAAVVGVLCKLLGITDEDLILWLVVLVGFVPMAITWLVTIIRDEPAPE
jgi:hypothetical protein